LHHGTAVVVIRSEEGAKGCVLTASTADISQTVQIGFVPVNEPKDDDVNEIISGGVLDMSVDELLANEKAVAVLKKHAPAFLANPMLSQIKTLSLRKLGSMGGSDLLSMEGLKELEDVFN
jgi:hypothetical protein